LKKSDLVCLSPKLATSTLAIAELARGPGAAVGDLEKARRRDHLQQVEASVEAISFDVFCARAYGAVCGAVERIGRKPRGARTIDLMIAATALAHELPLYTLNPKDLRGLADLVQIVDVSS
jgi:predicted nucleic acid-binding protein